MFKGQRNNNGRPKGSPNKSTKEIREAIRTIVEGNVKQLEADLKTLQPKDRIKCIIDLASFVLPKLKATELTTMEAKDGITPIEISFLD
mgnify:CR=1 FL=1|tara:strand:- start:4925 stop:5191 length:267 start_codon:yes stop_codon:yes gene_type:complete